MAGGLDVDTTVTCKRPTSSTTFGSCSGAPGPWQSGDAVVVKVDYDYHLIWPLASGTASICRPPSRCGSSRQPT